ncbi:hypothetical protein [Streptomyces sp. NPDC087300]|uniref:hypothetical protein n=1 Tax=Streptomyces sp. NPDC087300 TaxID=3365780 RepID=UPI0038237ECC
MPNSWNQRIPQLPRRLGLMACGALTAWSVTACGAGATDETKDTSPGPTRAPELRLGQPGPTQEITSYKTTGKFALTPTKVVEGTPKDLEELDDPKKYAGQKVVWVYVHAKHVGGDAVKEPTVMSDFGVETAAGPGTRFVLIGVLSSTPKDCNLFDGAKELGTDDIWKKREERTVCEPYLVPAKTKVTKVTYHQGFYGEPLKWSVTK